MRHANTSRGPLEALRQSQGAEPIDDYAATAGAYPSTADSRSDQIRALEPLYSSLGRRSGVVLDIGADDGTNSLLVLERSPDATVLAVKPSAAMRALILAKLDAQPEWHDRLTVRPERFAEAPLPDSLAGGIARWGYSGISIIQAGTGCPRS